MSTPVVVQRLLVPPAGSFFLFGPRGTGKTTWLRGAFPDAVYVDLLDDVTRRPLLAHPERLAGRIIAEAPRKVVIVDEIQKAPGLLDVVHRLIEAKRGYRFILTGSSARKLKRTGVNLLGGRALLRHLHPFLAAELGEAFRLDEALQIGMIPLIRAAYDPMDQLQAYIGLTLREEVEAEGLVRRIDHFARFLEVAAISHATVLNVSNVARECEVSRRAVEGYHAILEDLHLAYRIPVFTRRAQRAKVSHPKFYLADTGLFRALRPSGPLDRPEEIGGQAIEGLVGQHLRAWIDYRGRREGLFYWRTQAGSEVDFVVYGTQGLCGIEVKSAGKIRPEDLRGLKSFREEYPSARCLFVYRGRDRVVVDGILAIPCEEFLRRLRPAAEIESMARSA